MRGSRLLSAILAGAVACASSGCSLVLPEISHQPVIRNPFPQLSRVAIAPFFNHSDEPTVDGRQFSLAYYSELQKTPGFEVVPLGVVEEAILTHRIDLNGPGEARRLAQLLAVDAVVVGAVTEFTPYYPPRCGLRAEWYAANPGYHEIPAGYGLPWHTPEEEFIPDSLVYESQLALARAQLQSQTPDCNEACEALPQPPTQSEAPQSGPAQSARAPVEVPINPLRLAQATEVLPPGDSDDTATEARKGEVDPSDASATTGAFAATLTTAPRSSCFAPAYHGQRPSCVPHHGPVLSHTRIYHGSDPDVTEALKSYVYFSEDVRLGGWKSYLQRSDDFTRFCCHLHISEMLSARGGSRKTRVVWRWPNSR